MYFFPDILWLVASYFQWFSCMIKHRLSAVVHWVTVCLQPHLHTPPACASSPTTSLQTSESPRVDLASLSGVQPRCALHAGAHKQENILLWLRAPTNVLSGNRIALIILFILHEFGVWAKCCQFGLSRVRRPIATLSPLQVSMELVEDKSVFVWEHDKWKNIWQSRIVAWQTAGLSLGHQAHPNPSRGPDGRGPVPRGAAHHGSWKTSLQTHSRGGRWDLESSTAQTLF